VLERYAARDPRGGIKIIDREGHEGSQRKNFMSTVIFNYLDLLDSQREAALGALNGLTDTQLRQRPAPKEWSIGEILDHNYLLFRSFYPSVKWMWKWFGWYGRLRRNRPYQTEIEDLYRSPKFPQWVGFM
jgi:hypothetical protein